MKPKPLIAELLGTFALTLAVLISINNPALPISTPVVAGLTLGLFVYTIGPVSGCHINPAVTIGVAAIGKIGMPTAGFYIVAQFAGGVLALGAGGLLTGPSAELIASNSLGTGAAELLGAAVFLFGIGAVVLGVVPKAASGLVIGGSLTLGVYWAAPVSNGVLNPAVALGIGSFSWAYIWGPIVGAVVGTVLCRIVTRDVAAAGDAAG